jgi:hypothetical protein
MISVDSYFTNGNVNKVCQDYTLYEGGNFPVPYIIVCDGCSSSMNTDVGARILAHIAKKVLHENIDPDYLIDYSFPGLIEYRIVEKIKKTLDSLELSEGCMDSTLLISFIKSDRIYTYFFGDGQVFIKYKNGDTKLITVSYKGNAPFYLSYELNKDRKSQFIEYSKEDEHPLLTRNIETIHNEFCKNENSIYFARRLPDYNNNIKDIEYYLVMSDGTESFINKETGDRIHSLDIMKEFSSFKNTTGEFIKRRVRRAMEDLSKINIVNTDDISVAGFYFNKE